jgi:hypothetical protein
MKTPSLWMIAAACFIAPASVAHARSAYDGSWDLVFVTQRGSCDPSYNFTVNVSDGIVTHPNLVKFKGYVAKSGSVRASVTVHDKFASGTGRFFGMSGRGKWSGRAGARDARVTGPRSAIEQFEKGSTVSRAADVRRGIEGDRAGSRTPVCFGRVAQSALESTGRLPPASLPPRHF